MTTYPSPTYQDVHSTTLEVSGLATVGDLHSPTAEISGLATVGSLAVGGSLTVGGLPVSLGGNRIINGNFSINQRAQVSNVALTAANYGHDRWKAGVSGCTYTFTQTVPDTTITITAGTLTQVIEAGIIEGGNYVLSWIGTAQARVYQGTPTGAYAASPIVVSSLPSGVNTIVEFNPGTLGKIKFETGSVATVFNRQSLSQVMLDCLRYFQKLGGTTPGDLVLEGYAAPSPNSITITSSISPMRIAPVVTQVGTFLKTNVIGAGPSFVTTPISLVMSLPATVTGYVFWGSNGGHIELNAEL